MLLKMIFIIFFFSSGLTYNNFNELKGDMQNRAKRIASAIEGIMEHKCQKQTFQCKVKSFDICSGTGERSCLENFPTSKTCEGVSKYSPTSGIRIPNSFDITNLAEQTKYYICKTAEPQFENVYRNLLIENQKDYAWLNFGFNDGSHRVSPGFKYEKETTTASCKDYDPRLRPWYATNVYQRKKMVILVQNSRSIHQLPDRYNTIKYSIQALLKTADKGDYFNIIEFSDTARALLAETDKKLVSLSQQMDSFKGGNFYQFISSKISKSPSPQRNYRKALELAVQLLANSQQQNSDSQNMILMFSGFLPQNYSSSNGVSQFQQFLTKKENQLKMNFLFFGFGVTMIQETAKQLLKNITCSFDGIFFNISDVKYESQFLNQARGFYEYLSYGNQMKGFRWTDIYEDAFGLGQMTTVVKAAYYDQNGVKRLIGVAGVDVLLSQLIVYKSMEQIKTFLHVTESPFIKVINGCLLENIRRTHRCTKAQVCPIKSFCQPTMIPANESVLKDSFDSSDLACCFFQKSSNAGLIIGLTLGISLGIFLLVFLVYCLIFRKSSHTLLQQTYSQIFKQFKDFDQTRIRSQSETSLIKE